MPGKYKSAFSTPFGAASGNWIIRSNPSNNGIIAFGEIANPSRWVEDVIATGTDVWNFVSGKNGGGLRAVITLHSRGSSIGDDVRIVMNPASGGTYPTSTTGANCAIDAMLLAGSVYQFRFKPGNASAVPTEVLRLDGNTLVTSLMGGFVAPVSASKTTAYTVTLADFMIRADATGGVFDVTLPNANTCAGQVFIVKRTSAANTVTVKATGGTLDGVLAATGIALDAQFKTRAFQSDGTNWHIVGAYL